MSSPGIYSENLLRQWKLWNYGGCHKVGEVGTQIFGSGTGGEKSAENDDEKLNSDSPNWKVTETLLLQK